MGCFFCRGRRDGVDEDEVTSQEASQDEVEVEGGGFESGEEEGESDEGKDIGFLLITHYPRILKYVPADVVHILIDGRIVKTGGPELADEIERDGYDGVRASTSSAQAEAAAARA